MIHPLISVEELRQHSGDNLVIIDCRFSLADTELGQQQYNNGHIAGAYYLHLNRDLSAPLSQHGGRHPLPSTEQFQSTMRDQGINDETLVVAYDDQRFAFASRLWWLLRYFGHDNVQILDGGFSAWQSVNGAIDILQPAAASGRFTARAQSDWVVSYDNVYAHLNSEQRLLIDSREAPRYQGLEEPIDPIAGHIPGAANYPWQEVTDGQGMAHTPANLQHRWAALPQEKELVVYCGSGVTACVNLLSLELAGIQGAKLYAGSWSDWCSYHHRKTAE